MSENKPYEIPKSLGVLLGGESAQITFNNMKKLCNQDEYEIEGVTYKRKILKPKELVTLYRLQKELDEAGDNIDPQKRMDNIQKQAQVCLTQKDGSKITQEQWDNTDAVKMEIIIGACLLINKGFREV